MFPNLKPHYIRAEDRELLLEDVQARYEVEPVMEKECDVITLDAGGMCYVEDNFLNFEIEGYPFRVKPELLEGVLYRWGRPKDRAGMKKVYSSWYCYLFPEDLYTKIGAKLVELLPIAELERDRMIDALSDCKNVYAPKRNKKKVESFDA